MDMEGEFTETMVKQKKKIRKRRNFSQIVEQQKEKPTHKTDDSYCLKSCGIDTPGTTSQFTMPLIHFADVDDIKNINLEINFSQAKKKQTKKDKLENLLIEDNDEEKNEAIWFDTDRDYTYDELLKLFYEIFLEQHPNMVVERKLKLTIRPPQLLRVGTKKTAFVNFIDIAKTLHRPHKHLLDFLLTELGTNGSMDGNQNLIIKGRFEVKQLENLMRRYIKEYVICQTCRSPETFLQKNKRLFFLQCEACGCKRSVADIKPGFQAITSKRASMLSKKNIE